MGGRGHRKGQLRVLEAALPRATLSAAAYRHRAIEKVRLLKLLRVPVHVWWCCKEGRLVVPLVVSFCFFLRADANSVRWRALCAPRALPRPPEGQVAMSSTQQPKLPYWQLSRAHTHK